MSNIVNMGQSCEFLLSRAARHRRAGRYDEAMALLLRAREQQGFPEKIHEEIELEAARNYDEIGCEEEAARSYLRVVRIRGKRTGQALFHLALSCAQRSDLRRAVSYYQLYLEERKRSEKEDPDAISQEVAQLLGRQLREEMQRPPSRSRRAHVRALERRAAEFLQKGKACAAECAMKHAAALRPSAQSFTLLACCSLIRQQYRDAVAYARAGHELSPARVQTLCVLADAYAAEGKMLKAKRALYLAAMRAGKTDDLFAVALESAKYGEDQLTLVMTRRILKREPFHTRAMMMRACALTNLGRIQEAIRLFGRLCGLLPEDTVCESYFRMLKSGKLPEERLSMGADVLRDEGVSRAGEVMRMLYQPAEQMDKDEMRRACRLCAWAIRSPMIGTHIRTAALIVLGSMPGSEGCEMLKDALMDAQTPDMLKMAILQMLTAKHGFYPYEVDMDGRLVRLAAGGVSTQPVKGTAMNQKIVQRAADALMREYPDAAQVLLPLFLEYLRKYPAPENRHETACAAALEYVFHHQAKRIVSMETIAGRYGESKRLCMMYARRLLRISSGDTRKIDD